MAGRSVPGGRYRADGWGPVGLARPALADGRVYATNTDTLGAVSALTDLALDRVFVVFPGDSRFALRERVEAVGLAHACAEGL